MKDSKKRAELRAAANKEDTIIQIGKEGITENVLAQTDSALTARELIKGKVLETAPVTPREAADIICDKLHAVPVQCIGSKFVIYRENPEKAQKSQAIKLEKPAASVRAGTACRRRGMSGSAKKYVMRKKRNSSGK